MVGAETERFLSVWSCDCISTVVEHLSEVIKQTIFLFRRSSNTSGRPDFGQFAKPPVFHYFFAIRNTVE